MGSDDLETSEPLISLVVGGPSELIYLDAVLSTAHPHADLRRLGIEIHSADGDSKIPELADRLRQEGRNVVVLYDRDALERAHEQAEVLRTEGITIHELDRDFEATFDPEIVELAVRRLGFRADRGCLDRAKDEASGAVFAAIESCAEVVDAARPLSKVRLAEACAAESWPKWYLPSELYELAIALGEKWGLSAFSDTSGWDDGVMRAVAGRGRLYVSNHVSNTELLYWDFNQNSSGSVALGEEYDGRVAICRNGRRIVLRKHDRSGRGVLPDSTQILVMDLDGDALVCAHQFTMRDSVYDVSAEEDGNHLNLSTQDRRDRKRRIRCLADGTQRQSVELTSSDGLYAACASRNGRLVASGPRPLEITEQGSQRLTLPHFYACSYAWSPDARFLAFFGRRWGRIVKSQDCHWILDLSDNTIHRVALGDSHMPTYWARPG